MKKYLFRIVSFAIPVLLSAAVLISILQSRQPPERAAVTERVKSVRVITVEPVDFIPTVTGFGIVEPLRNWEAIAQVPGRVEFVHPKLKVGTVIPADTEIVRIAQEDYRFAVQEENANLGAENAKLKELTVRAANTELSLEIERRSLRIKQEEVTRQRNLVERGISSQSTLDNVERDFLQQSLKVQELENSIRLFPAELEHQEARIAVASARLETAKLELERTRIKTPFTGRISEMVVEATQFVASGSKLAALGDVSAAEIAAQIPQDQFAEFIALAFPKDLHLDLGGQPDIEEVLEGLQWEAYVEIDSGTFEARWPARVLRTSATIDADSRTIGVFVMVDNPYRDVRPGVRPPLVKGMFVRVVLRSEALHRQRVVPRTAVHEGRVFVANSQDRLEIREVKVLAFQGAEALIESGLEWGDRVVVSDIAPVIENMLLRPLEVKTGSTAELGSTKE